ncbi:MAG: Methylated DNA-protein cysteine methyltransferase [Candidatus Saccharibacteria bacterium]|nr:Methylated DNA-protein cysteine methyltransferase [Candidatus Saccharibacteria bacterium]
MEGQKYEVHPDKTWVRDDSLPLLAQTVQELDQYFSGKPVSFSAPLQFQGSDFQKHTWQLLAKIPYGKTITYAEIARLLGDPGAVRNVGSVIGMNPISVIVPCHRVIASNGKLTGYNGGLVRKQLLLDLESGKLQLAL